MGRFSKSFVYLAAMAVLCTGVSAHADSGRDFIDEARLFYRVVACGDDTPAPGKLNQRVVAAHCKQQKKGVARFRKRYVERAQRFLARHRPAQLPDRVVYPFGGGDLASALITYPDAAEITTISLEHAGDPRRLAKLGARQLRDSLALFREAIYGLLYHHDSASEKMRRLEKGPIPGQLAFFIQALAATEHEPVWLKFFRIEDDGSLHYYTAAEIAELDGTTANKKSVHWVDTDYSVAFTNMELAFRRRGAGPDAPVRIHRHIAANLNNPHFRDSPLQRHLRQKGKIAAMTKAASYLLWLHNFSAIRKYLLGNMVFMVSDSTGIPPRYAARAGFEQRTFGMYTGAFLEAPDRYNQEFIELWAEQPRRRLPFRYGYPDAARNWHMLITYPKKRRSRSKRRK